MQKKIEFGIVGGGWRAEFFLRIAKMLPEKFRVAAMMVRNPEKGAAIESAWGVKTFSNLDDFIKKSGHSFVVLSVPSDVAGKLTIDLANRRIPVLMETPPARDVSGLTSLFNAVGASAKVQVAEQYAFQPMHAARLNLIKSGKLGKISQAQVSVTHDYHGISLMRRFLDIGFDDATIHGFSFKAPVVAGPGRNGAPEKETINMSGHSIAYLEFDGKLGVYDFSFDQYFSWIRAPRVLVRGERGETNNTKISYLEDFKTPVQTEFLRQEAGQDGNLEGLYLKGILAGSEWAYKNPFVPGRLSDDEIAIATCLEKMEAYVDRGIDFYSLAEASQDTYLGIMMNRAISSGERVRTEKQVWS
ncbi:MAG TPA: oxidoreductase [Lentisphaeria bacterium]|nr:MAG: oxidoreductase [Lentisphaerae bacterium GWF2_49_21]HBC88747.1 oxidoreductase [Lentisphaeria bacterium]